MLSPGMGQAAFRIAVLITLVSAGLVWLEPRDSPEFVLSVTTLVIGLVFALVIALLVRRGR